VENEDVTPCTRRKFNANKSKLQKAIRAYHLADKQILNPIVFTAISNLKKSVPKLA
jgi:hypothetical protein